MFFNKIQQKWNDATSAVFGRALAKLRSGRMNARDQARPIDFYMVKEKLGASFFTRKLTPATRRARISSLTTPQRRLAATKGWI